MATRTELEYFAVNTFNSKFKFIKLLTISFFNTLFNALFSNIFSKCLGNNMSQEMARNINDTCWTRRSTPNNDLDTFGAIQQCSELFRCSLLIKIFAMFNVKVYNIIRSFVQTIGIVSVFDLSKQRVTRIICG